MYVCRYNKKQKHLIMETLTDLSNKQQDSSSNDTSHAALVHLSSFSSFLMPFGSILGPLVTWMIWRDESDFVDQNGKQALNFNLSFALYNIAIAILGVVLFITPILAMLETNGGNPVSVLLSLPGLLLLGSFSFIGIFKLIIIIVAAIQSGNGKVYHYPLTIQFIK